MGYIIASLFAGVLFRMYSRYVERKHWKLEILNSNDNELKLQTKPSVILVVGVNGVR